MTFELILDLLNGTATKNTNQAMESDAKPEVDVFEVEALTMQQ